MNLSAPSQSVNAHSLLGAFVPNQTSWFPSFSTHAARLPKEEVERALDFFLKGNPLFSAYTLVERRVASPAAVTYDWLYDELENGFDGFASNFKVAVVTFDSNSDQTGIFVAVPFCRIDGLTAYKFHEALVETITTKADCFRNAAAVDRLRIDCSGFLNVPPSFSQEAKTQMVRPFFSRTDPGPLRPNQLEQIASDQSSKLGARGVGMLVNLAYREKITFGNHLVYPIVPADNLAGGKLKSELLAARERCIDALVACASPEDFQNYIGTTLAAVGNTFIINNYGDWRELGSRSMLDYKWSFPTGLAANFAGALLAITIGRTAPLVLLSSRTQISLG